jgi:RNA polymerase sigma factor (sigma-70 family)
MPPQPWNAVVRQIRRLVGPAESDEVTDRRLLEAFAARQDQPAFTRLVERHGPMVMNVCRRSLASAQDAEDAFQAVFCVLARKAGSIQWQESVGSWLYGVAYRVACKARVRAARRRAHERKVAAMRLATSPQRTTEGPALDTLLDGELNRLPEKYRAPLVLCYLEGQTNEEAARLLGWPKGTVQGRLARGRELLRTRLARRGLALSAASFTVAATENLVAAVPASLIPTTIQTALRFAAGPAGAAEPVAGAVAVLAEGVLRTMWWKKVKFAALMLLFAGTLAGVGLFARHFLAERQAVAAPLPAEPAQGIHAVLSMADGIMVDKDDQSVYAVNTDGGIDALELKTGKLLWKTPKGESYWPLAVVDKRLVARARDENRVKVFIAVLDISQNGKPVVKSDSVAPPLSGYAWLDSRVVGGANIPRPVHTFHADESIAKGELVINWKSHTEIPNFRRFVPPVNPQEQEREVRDESGTVQVNLETGKVKVTEGEKSSKQIKGPVAPQPPVGPMPPAKIEVGDYELSVDAKQSLEKGAFTTTLRTLKVMNKQSGKLVWEHALKSTSVGFAP